jgi:hypothetical protein
VFDLLNLNHNAGVGLRLYDASVVVIGLTGCVVTAWYGYQIIRRPREFGAAHYNGAEHRSRETLPLPGPAGASDRLIRSRPYAVRRRCPREFRVGDGTSSEGVLVGNTGQVTGYALSRLPRPDVVAHEARVTDSFTGWAGHVLTARFGEIRAYGLIDHDRSACLLGAHVVTGLK